MMKRHDFLSSLRLALTPLLLCVAPACLTAQSDPDADRPALRPQVEIEEEVYQFQNADNGAGPMWCSGSSCLVRGPSGLFASGLETIADLKPLNNCRWLLFRRSAEGWKRLAVDQQGRTREPCPIAGYHDGQLFLSVNPTLTEPNQYGGPARPEILKINASQENVTIESQLPQWQGDPRFSEHSYRSFAADGKNRELILFQNVGYAHAEWAFRDSGGGWAAAGQLKWPWGAEYDKPQPIRICYPNVMLKDRAVHFCGVSDIVEPYGKFRDFKKKLTGRDWDYDFRRLFYTWSDDVTSGKFHSWVEIASRDDTCGWLRPCDLWVGDDQRVHILWTERALDERLRAEFFPDAKQSTALNYAVVEAGTIVLRRSLVLAEEGGLRETVGAARFQVTESGRLCVFYYVNGTATDGKRLSENRVMEILPDGTSSQSVPVPFQQPFVSYFTASVRNGSPRSNVIELLGEQAGRSNTMSYARVRLW